MMMMMMMLADYCLLAIPLIRGVRDEHALNQSLLYRSGCAELHAWKESLYGGDELLRSHHPPHLPTSH